MTVIKYQTADVDGFKVFYREVGRELEQTRSDTVLWQSMGADERGIWNANGPGELD